MRKFRAIVETPAEPQDHEVLWYWKGKLLYWGNDRWEPFHTNFNASDISFDSYFLEGDNVEDVLKELIRICKENQWYIGAVYNILDYDNLLSNSYFSDSVNGWEFDTLRPFRVGNKFIMVKKGFLSKTRSKVAVIQYNGFPTLDIKGNDIPCTITQKFGNYNFEVIDGLYKFPLYVTLCFRFKKESEGTIDIKLDNPAEGDTIEVDSFNLSGIDDDKWHTYKKTFQLRRGDNLNLTFNADLKIQSFYMRVNEAKTLIDKSV